MSACTPTLLVQLTHPREGRRVALVYGNELHLLATYRSLYSFARAALDTGWKLRDLLSTDLSGIVLNYDDVYALDTPWSFLPCFDHPDEPARCRVSSAGPPWRYIGSGSSLRGHGDPLPVAGQADVAVVYMIERNGSPRRVGVTAGHRGRVSAIGPEIILEPDLPRLGGVVKLLNGRGEMGGRGSGFAQMSLSTEVPLSLAFASIEPDHFDAVDFPSPGDVYIHFFGERLFDAAAGIRAGDEDQVLVRFEGLGRGLLNPIHFEEPALRRLAAVPL